MLNGDESRLCEEQRRINRVSSAVWPAKLRRGVPTDKAAQRRRDRLIQHRWGAVLVQPLSWRALLSVAALLMMAGSLGVALLGPSFWYLLLLPLLLFAAFLLLPLFWRNLPEEEEFSQEFECSTGALSHSIQERWRSALQFTEEDPVTPMPADLPLVRVLETYDLRETPVEHFLANIPGSEPGEQEAADRVVAGFWTYKGLAALNGHEVPYSQMGFVARQSEEGMSALARLPEQFPGEQEI